MSKETLWFANMLSPFPYFHFKIITILISTHHLFCPGQALYTGETLALTQALSDKACVKANVSPVRVL